MASLDDDFHKQDGDNNGEVPKPRGCDTDHSDDESSDYSDNGELPDEIVEYLEQFGDVRGKTNEELRAWHKEYAASHPKEGDPPPSDCKAGCHWADSEFSTGCLACLEASTALPKE